MENDDVAAQIHDEIARETASSPYRDRFSRDRVHPIHHDLMAIVNFTTTRRLRHEHVLLCASRALERVDTLAMRYLAIMTLIGGESDKASRGAAYRLLSYCEQIDQALRVGAAMRKERAHG